MAVLADYELVIDLTDANAQAYATNISSLLLNLIPTFDVHERAKFFTSIQIKCNLNVPSLAGDQLHSLKGLNNQKPPRFGGGLIKVHKKTNPPMVLPRHRLVKQHRRPSSVKRVVSPSGMQWKPKNRAYLSNHNKVKVHRGRHAREHSHPHPSHPSLDAEADVPPPPYIDDAEDDNKQPLASHLPSPAVPRPSYQPPVLPGPDIDPAAAPESSPPPSYSDVISESKEEKHPRDDTEDADYLLALRMQHQDEDIDEDMQLAMALQSEEERKAKERRDRRRQQRSRYRNPNFVDFGHVANDYADYLDIHSHPSSHSHSHNHSHGHDELDEGLPANFRRILSAEDRHAHNAQHALVHQLQMEQLHSHHAQDSDDAVMSAFSQPFVSDEERMHLLVQQMEHLRSLQQHEAAVNGLLRSGGVGGGLGGGGRRRVDESWKRLPTRVLRERDVEILAKSEEKKSCPICMTDFKSGDRTRQLPCFHEFHQECVDQWFQQQSEKGKDASCPLDRKKIKEIANQRV